MYHVFIFLFILWFSASFLHQINIRPMKKSVFFNVNSLIRGSWMGLSAWTIPEGIKNVHALNPIHEPRSYISLWRTILHTPLFCRLIPLIFQKQTKNYHSYCHFPHFSSRKIGDLLGMYHSKQGCALCVYIYAWAHITTKYLRRTSNFSA